MSYQVLIKHTANSLGMSGIALVLLMVSRAAVAADTLNAIDDVAMDGFDVMAYFRQGQPKKGVAQYSVQYKGKTWNFSSPGNAADFKASPEIYEPQFNGWCAYAVSEGYAAEVDFVDGWALLDGKLYLNWNASTRDSFIAEQVVRKARAESNWSKVYSGLVDGSVELYRHRNYPTRISHPQNLTD